MGQYSRDHGAFDDASRIWLKGIPLPFLLASAPLSQRITGCGRLHGPLIWFLGEGGERVQGETIERIPLRMRYERSQPCRGGAEARQDSIPNHWGF